MSKLNLSIEKLTVQKWYDFSIQDKHIIIGLLAVVGGWLPQISTGSMVLAEINN